ncbi:MAG: hypothetical protein A3H71_02780 [Candidatus Sungbacteria bacterium RIFCSPLOWO2_02_FULL_48_13b]|uniref:Histidine-specific methyltransferase SAM-dependent domain-containing protein n=1 Tax=Candidatus Sungbacteria bacterium RIFCSPLOWO2_02_FULL_48_13b TaxID=1802283 RepID=A0A1G2LHN9_9BACT|nr:MAG: hypothetical protein A3H71_02780 [Candidatus Sungbacteria bacterium RIFCSPLOWO2_02_FULL_48_13b]
MQNHSPTSKSKLAEDKAHFNSSFEAREYLKNYYVHIDSAMIRKYVLQRSAASETARIMIHLAEAAVPEIRSMFNSPPVILELGGGPTLYQLFGICDVAKEIHFTDFLEDNLREIRKWLQKSKGAFDWSQYAATAIMLQRDDAKANSKEIFRLEDHLRKKITKVAHCDIFLPDLGIRRKSYDVINTHFVAESATSSKQAWKRAIGNICRKLSSGGCLSCRRCLGRVVLTAFWARNFLPLKFMNLTYAASWKPTVFARLKLV